MLAKNSNSASISRAPHALLLRAPHRALGIVPGSVRNTAFAGARPALNSVPRLGVELCTNVLDDLGDEFVEVVKLIHKEGVVLGRVSGDDIQLVQCGPCNADRIGDHSCGDKGDMKQMCPRTGTANESLLCWLLHLNATKSTIKNGPQSMDACYMPTVTKMVQLLPLRSL